MKVNWSENLFGSLSREKNFKTLFQRTKFREIPKETQNFGEIRNIKKFNLGEIVFPRNFWTPLLQTAL